MKTFNLNRGLRSIALVLFLFGIEKIAAQQVIPPNQPTGKFRDYDQWKQHQVYVMARPNAARKTASVEVSKTLQSPAIACSDELIPLDGDFTGIPRNDDDSYGPIALPFVFSFCNNSFSEVYINTNGNLTFTEPLSVFSPLGFPIGLPMVAGFWADVDTRAECSGNISYKLESDALIVSWNSVGYYAFNCNYLNSFQIILTDGTSPLIGVGNSLQFRYGDMQWTTGAATSGYVDGFGGEGATVGFNSGNVNSFDQIGRFNQPGDVYDGPFENGDGVDYLDLKCFAFMPTVSNAVSAVCKPGFDVAININGYAEIGVEQIIDAPGGGCGFDNASIDPSLFYCDNLGPNEITLTVTDDQSNTTTCTTTINVVDNQPPTVECQFDVPAFIGENGTGVLDPATLVLTQYDQCGIVSYTADRTDFSCSDIGGLFEVLLTVADASGNEATCLATVYAYDPVSPVALCKDITVELTDEGDASVDPSDVDNGSSDNCSIVTYQVYPNTFTCDDAGQTYPVTLYVYDVSNYQGYCTAYVTIVGDGSDADCDGADNGCDVCPGADDSVDNNNDGIPDCSQLLPYNEYDGAWRCPPFATTKITVCHNGASLCVNFNALAAHFAHGDWVGPCTPCDENNTAAVPQPGFRLAPNPSNNNVLVDLHEYVGKNLALTLRDNYGRTLLEKNWKNLADDVVEIAFREQGWGAGVYHLTLNNEGEQTTLRVVITE